MRKGEKVDTKDEIRTNFRFECRFSDDDRICKMGDKRGIKDEIDLIKNVDRRQFHNGARKVKGGVGDKAIVCVCDHLERWASSGPAIGKTEAGEREQSAKSLCVARLLLLLLLLLLPSMARARAFGVSFVWSTVSRCLSTARVCVCTHTCVCMVGWVSAGVSVMIVSERRRSRR